MEEVMNGILIREVETKNIMTKSSLPVRSEEHTSELQSR